MKDVIEFRKTWVGGWEARLGAGKWGSFKDVGNRFIITYNKTSIGEVEENRAATGMVCSTDFLGCTLSSPVKELRRDLKLVRERERIANGVVDRLTRIIVKSLRGKKRTGL